MNIKENNQKNLMNNSSLGGVIALRGASHYCLIGIYGSFILLIIASLVFMDYERNIKAIGLVHPAGGLIAVRSNMTGTLDYLYAQDGTSIVKNQNIVKIENTKNSTINDDSRKLTIDSLHKQIDLNNASFENSSKQLNSIFKRVEIEGVLIDKQIVSLNKKIESINKQLSRKKENLKKFEKYKEVVPFNIMEPIESSIENLDLQVISSNIELNQLKERKELTLSKQSDTKIIIDNNARDHELKIIDLENKIRDEIEKSEAIIKSPVDGKLYLVAKKIGESIDEKQIVALVGGSDNDTNVVIEALVSGGDISLISIGNQVSIRFESYPHSQYGVFTGNVSKINSIPITSDEQAIFDKQQSPEKDSKYKVEVTIPKLEVKKILGGDYLRVGMSAEVEIRIDSVPLYKYFMIKFNKQVTKGSS